MAKPTPGQLAAMADKYFTTREQRLAMDRKAAELKEQERNIKAALIKHMREEDVGSIGGRIVTTGLVHKVKPGAADWDEIYGWILNAGPEGFSILQRRLTEGAVKEHWDNDDNIPGIVEVDIYDLSVTKRKRR